MYDPDPSSRDHRVAAHARREASRRGAAFSEELHGRIMRAVSDAGPATKVQSEAVPRPDDGTGFRTGPAIGAVLVAAVALVVLGRFHFEDPVVPVSVANINRAAFPSDDTKLWPVMENIGVVPARMKRAVTSAVEEEQFAGLDQDARHMTRYLVKQVPFQSQWNTPESKK